MHTFPSVETLLPHRAPAVVVDSILSFDKGVIRCVRKVRPDEHYGPGLSAEGVIELCAQAAILREAVESGKAMQRGVLASIDDFRFFSSAQAGDTVEAEVSVKTRLGNLALFECSATVNGARLAHGFIKAAQS